MYPSLYSLSIYFYIAKFLVTYLYIQSRKETKKNEGIFKKWKKKKIEIENENHSNISVASQYMSTGVGIA